MFWILNRLRGRYTYFAKLNALVVALLIFAFLGNFYLAIICGLGYLAGESKGWGVWVGALVTHGSYTSEHEVKFIERIARKIVKDPRAHWLGYCRVCLFLRGLLWWLPVFVPLLFAGIYGAPFLAVALAAGFPLACELGYRTKFSFAFKKFEVKTAWARQELFYGAMQDAAFIILWVMI
ncbi:hypothetical protein [uncultured Campylobacter sp.]|uniref:hypothetical protein n=1 Tax=uncultured Campylobacter sp. TaxID=218934 RepID=UPI00262B6AF2|nr:hypothetical protein [uncultured Campylobacter sp.]